MMYKTKIGRVVLQIQTDLGEIDWRDGQEWLVRKRLPFLANAPRVLSVRMFRGMWAMSNDTRIKVEPNQWLTGHPRHLALVELEHAAAAEGVMKLLAEHTLPGVRTERSMLYEQLSPNDGGAVIASGVTPNGEQPVGPVILHVLSDPEPEWEARNIAWYDKEHLGVKARLPGYMADRFFRRIGDVGEPHKFMAFYDLEGEWPLEIPRHASETDREMYAHLKWLRTIYAQISPPL